MCTHLVCKFEISAVIQNKNVKIFICNTDMVNLQHRLYEIQYLQIFYGIQ